MSIYRVGSSVVELGRSEFVSQGGQGSIYAKSGVAYKIYTDPSKMPPVDKIRELSTLTMGNIIRPVNLIEDKSRNPVGYTMKFVAGSHPLCRLFTRTFKDAHKIKPDTVLKLVERMKATIDFIHKNDVLIVDLNELNHILEGNFSDVYFIDVDSYQTRSYPASVIMDSIRDRHSKKFSELTDWFSFGILSFQMFIGIHPFKGTHRSIVGLDERMKANVSALNKDVSIPNICYPKNIIPKDYLDWYTRIFEKGERIPPPMVIGQVIVCGTKFKVTISKGILELKETMSLDHDIVKVFGSHILTTGGLQVSNRLLDHNIPADAHLSQSNGSTHFMWIDPKGMLVVYDLSKGAKVASNIEAEQIMSYNGSVYIKRLDKVYLVDVTVFKDTSLVNQTIVSNVMENATKLYDGCIYQNLLGSCYLYTPSNKSSYQMWVKELDDHRMIDAKRVGSVVMTITEKNGKYYRSVIKKISAIGGSYEFRQEKTDNQELNFAVLANGVCVHIPKEGILELFYSDTSHHEVKQVKDKQIGTEMRLWSQGVQTLISVEDTLYEASLKK